MNTIKALTVLILALLVGCQTAEKDQAGFEIYIESWDRISFSNPYYGNWFVSKSEATQFIREKQDTVVAKARVMLGKNIHMDHESLDEDMDDIQTWLVSEGIEYIVFELATSCISPPITRIYHDGKITTPNQRVDLTVPSPAPIISERNSETIQTPVDK